PAKELSGHVVLLRGAAPWLDPANARATGAMRRRRGNLRGCERRWRASGQLASRPPRRAPREQHRVRRLPDLAPLGRRVAGAGAQGQPGRAPGRERAGAVAARPTPGARAQSLVAGVRSAGSLARPGLARGIDRPGVVPRVSPGAAALPGVFG